MSEYLVRRRPEWLWTQVHQYEERRSVGHGMLAVSQLLAVGHFLSLSNYIDVAIPRGGESLIRRVAAEATMTLGIFSANQAFISL